jgi:hypothetical protein
MVGETTEGKEMGGRAGVAREKRLIFQQRVDVRR